jgi:HK97 family phage major capsid protein
MNTYSKMLPIIDSTDYENHFWNALRGKKGHKEHLEKGVESNTGAYTMTTKGQNKFATAIKNESIFRNIATAVQVFDHDYRIKTVGINDVAAWVAEGGTIPLSDGMEDFGEITLGTHKLAVFLKLEETLVRDPFFKIEDYLVKRLAKNFGKAEDYGFIRGTGVDMPTGILADEGGAEIGATAKVLTYDDVVKLFFSVKPEYRRNGVWMMNDETALALRIIKDADGNYIWNHANDTILGHKVCISEHMPSAESGSKPIAFGDFSYYWIVCRRPVSVRTLVEQFAMMDCIGYLAYEFLDGKLVRPEAIKVMQITK